MSSKTPGWTEQWVRVMAERKFREYARDLGKGLTPSLLAYLAQTDTPLSEVLRMTGKEVQAIPKARQHPGGRHLLALSDQKILALLREAIPAHATVLDRFPAYASKMASELKQLVLGGPAS